MRILQLSSRLIIDQPGLSKWFDWSDWSRWCRMSKLSGGPGGLSGPGCPGGPGGPGGHGCLGGQGGPSDQVCQCILFPGCKQSNNQENLRCHACD